jgi:phosphoserine phosphatase RsbU/P
MAMPSTYPRANKVPAGRRSVGTRINQFWQRTTDGLELNQLWNQFRIDTRTSYRLYSRGIDYTCRKGVNGGKHWQAVSMQLFWAILEKLSPARRVLLLLALLLCV